MLQLLAVEVELRAGGVIPRGTCNHAGVLALYP